MPDEISASNNSVIDFALFSDPLRTVQALRNSGIIPNDAAQADIQMAKRIHRALTADYSGDPTMDHEALAGMRTEFNHYVNTLPYDQMVAEGHVNRLLDEYLGLLVKASRKAINHLDEEPLDKGETGQTPAEFNTRRRQAEARLIKYIGERGYYENNPDAVKEVARQFETLIKQSDYLPIGKIAALSGACGGDSDCVADLIHDVLAVQAARSLKALLKEFSGDPALTAYAGNPEANALRIQALAERVAQATAPLSSLKEFVAETPEFDRIAALSTLVSAELHYALMQERDPGQMIAVEREARRHLTEAAQTALSLAYHYLDTGPSAQDPRTRTIQANLRKEMDAAGIALLSSEEASAKAGEIARKAAEDLLQVQQAHDHPELVQRITALAQAAGTEPPIEAKSHLIGEDLLAIIREKLGKPNVIAPQDLRDWVGRLGSRDEKGGALAVG